MKEIVVISGKGGTGKTTFVLGLAQLMSHTVLADCDVDAADMHLVLQPDIRLETPFSGGKVAEIDKQRCTACGICRDVCVYDAITPTFFVDPLGCEGCGACHVFCPEDAIRFEPDFSGTVFHSESRFGPFYHARLQPGGENSGKLVTRVRNDARDRAVKDNAAFILVDGSPGVGCPVVASITGSDYVVVVTEPTVSGVHDLERVLSLMGHFQLAGGVVVNKFDLHPEMGHNIADLARRRGVDFLGNMPYDVDAVIGSMNAASTVLEHSPDAPFSQALREIHGRTMQALKSNSTTRRT